MVFWAFPEIKPEQNTSDYCLQALGQENLKASGLIDFRHTFSHYHLEIEAIHIKLDKPAESIMEDPGQLWYNIEQPQQVGLSAPATKILTMLNR